MKDRGTVIYADGLFRGNTVDCMHHYLVKLPWQRGSMAAQQPLMESAGVSFNSIRDWHAGVSLPRGLTLVKLRYFLERNGYKVSELQNIDESIRQLGKLVASDAISVDRATALIGCHESGHLFRILHGSRSVSQERLSVIRRIVREYGSGSVESSELSVTKAAGITKRSHQGPVSKPDPNKASRDRACITNLTSAANSLVGLLGNIGIAPESVVDGDRMAVLRLVQRLLVVFGIDETAIKRLGESQALSADSMSWILGALGKSKQKKGEKR